MIISIFEILATLVVCATGSVGGALFAFGISEKSVPMIVGGLSLAPAGIAIGYGIHSFAI